MGRLMSFKRFRVIFFYYVWFGGGAPVDNCGTLPSCMGRARVRMIMPISWDS